jgi:hypothetical protein
MILFDDIHPTIANRDALTDGTPKQISYARLTTRR